MTVALACAAAVLSSTACPAASAARSAANPPPMRSRERVSFVKLLICPSQWANSPETDLRRLAGGQQQQPLALSSIGQSEHGVLVVRPERTNQGLGRGHRHHLAGD